VGTDRTVFAVAQASAPGKVLTGRLFALKWGSPCGMLPPELGCGSGITCWRHLRT
jgi:hypothetical protein